MKRVAGGGWWVVGVAILAAAGYVLYGPIPAIPTVTSPTVVDRNGVVLYEPLGAGGVRSAWVNDVPPRVAEATIAAEDRRFYSHPGLDPIAIARAAWHDIRRGALVEGGSTLTQQVAKHLVSANTRGVITKIREAVIALRLERRYTKGAILALYCNLVPYGNQIDGIGRASRVYFGVAPEELTDAQAAFLAALPQKPGSIRHALARQRVVLRRMKAPAEAFRERLRFDRGVRPILAQHFIERVLERWPVTGARTPLGVGSWGMGDVAFPPPTPNSQPPTDTGHRTPTTEIRTTLDAQLQRTVRGIIDAHRDTLLRHGAHSVAVAVLDNATGDWLAWEGSGDYFGEQFGGAIDGVVALRQPGSTLKPFTYALAFEHGYSPASVLPDVPASFPTAQDGIVYTPRNYDGAYRGPLRARNALAGSENVPAVALLSRIGAPSLLRLLRDVGFHDLTRTADYYGLGLTLGDAEVRLDQLVAAYATFARGGVYVEPRMLANEQVTSRRLLTPRTAFWITDILSDPQAREFIFGRGGSLEFPFAVAVKTGTSQAYRDNWTIGYTRDITVGVWVGNFDRTELRHSSGVTGAAPIFHDVMIAAAHPRETILETPPNVERAPVCALSGLRPSLSCPTVEEEWVASDTPVAFCSWHHAGGAVDWPDEYRQWARVSARPAPPRTAREARAATLRIANPPDGATYLIDPTLRMPYQTLRLQANADVAWRIDDRRVDSEWPLAPGRHVVTAIDDAGRRASAKIFVK
jgi:penicillin-binding protein 1C